MQGKVSFRNNPASQSTRQIEQYRSGIAEKRKSPRDYTEIIVSSANDYPDYYVELHITALRIKE